VAFLPPVSFYKPQGVPLDELKGAVLPIDGLEALRLVDALGMDHDEAAARMDVSRPTLSRLLAEARRIVATALINGWALRIEGGDVEFVEPDEAEGNGTEGGPRCCRKGRGPHRRLGCDKWSNDQNDD